MSTCAGHAEALATYRDTFHGQVTRLGFAPVAKCADCHRPHHIFKASDARSRVSPANLVTTCGTCHARANANFVKYQPHANQHDPRRLPPLYCAARFMDLLLIGVVTFFGLHTVPWFVRERHPDARVPPTRLPLRFSDAVWAKPIATIFGGFGVTGTVHRVFATVLIALFVTHVSTLIARVARGDLGLLWGPRSLVPQPHDLWDLYAHLKWFLRRGPKPSFDRYTYWEKFDYWAVFWGMFIIGGSGLLLWFPEFFARLLPGWVFNVALLVHGEEALLAIGFIVTIHFFNSHMRPHKFPIDLVMFTGVVQAEEYRQERPLEVARLEAEGQLARRVTGPPDAGFVRGARIVGGVAIVLELTLFVMIIVAVLSR